MEILSFEIPEKLIYFLIIIAVSYIMILLDNYFINRLIKKNNNKSKHIKRSQDTVLILIKNVIKTFIYIVAGISILKLIGVDTTALVTSVGAVSVVAGLAFQDILKDYLVGITIVLESQFAIGEIVEINGFKGEVIYLGLKTTKIKALTGEVKIISNRNITDIINYSLNRNLIAIEVSVSYEDDNDKVEKVLSDLANKLPKLVPEITKTVTLDGISKLDDSAVVYRLSTYARDRDRNTIIRKVNKEIKKTLDQNEIKIPYNQIEVHNEK